MKNIYRVIIESCNKDKVVTEARVRGDKGPFLQYGGKDLPNCDTSGILAGNPWVMSKSKFPKEYKTFCDNVMRFKQDYIYSNSIEPKDGCTVKFDHADSTLGAIGNLYVGDNNSGEVKPLKGFINDDESSLESYDGIFVGIKSRYDDFSTIIELADGLATNKLKKFVSVTKVTWKKDKSESDKDSIANTLYRMVTDVVKTKKSLLPNNVVIIRDRSWSSELSYGIVSIGASKVFTHNWLIGMTPDVNTRQKIYSELGLRKSNSDAAIIGIEDLKNDISESLDTYLLTKQEELPSDSTDEISELTVPYLLSNLIKVANSSEYPVVSIETNASDGLGVYSEKAAKNIKYSKRSNKVLYDIYEVTDEEEFGKKLGKGSDSVEDFLSKSILFVDPSEDLVDSNFDLDSVEDIDEAVSELGFNIAPY